MMVASAGGADSLRTKYLELVASNAARRAARQKASLLDWKDTVALIPEMRPVLYEEEAPWVYDLLQKDAECRQLETVLCAQDPPHWCHNWAKIWSWGRTFVHFRFNAIQWHLFTHRTDYTLVLKFRRGGVTLLFLIAVDLHDALYLPNINAVLLGQLKPDTTDSFQRAKIVYENLPPFLKPIATKDTESGWRFKELPGAGALNSSFLVATAGTKNARRGNDADRLQITEFSFFEDPKAVKDAITQSTRDNPQIIIETTSQPTRPGGRELHAMVNLCQKPDASKYRLLFYPWWCGERNRENPAKYPNISLDAEVVGLGEAHELGRDQLIWYQLQKNDLQQRVRWEHPSTIKEAFLGSEESYYDVNALARLSARAQQIAEGRHKEIRIQPRQDKDPRWFDLAMYDQYGARVGGIWIYERPKPNWQYRAGADVAEGIERDESALVILDAESRRQVCVAHSNRWTTWEFAQLIWEITWFYGRGNRSKCPVLVESTGLGASVIQELQRMIGMGSQFDRQRADIWLASVGVPGKEGPKRPGCEATAMRDVIWAQSVMWMREEWIGLVDFITVEQAREIFSNAKKHNRADHPKNGRDDVLWATWLAALLSFEPGYAWTPRREDKVEYKSAMHAWVGEEERLEEERQKQTRSDLVPDWIDERAEQMSRLDVGI